MVVVTLVMPPPMPRLICWPAEPSKTTRAILPAVAKLGVSSAQRQAPREDDLPRCVARRRNEEVVAALRLSAWRGHRESPGRSAARYRRRQQARGRGGNGRLRQVEAETIVGRPHLKVRAIQL